MGVLNSFIMEQKFSLLWTLFSTHDLHIFVEKGCLGDVLRMTLGVPWSFIISSR